MPSSKFTEAPPKCQLHSLGCQGFCESDREVKEELCQKCLEQKDARFSGAKGDAWHFGYTNYRGEYSERRATPIRFEFTHTEHHPEEQWIMFAMDHDKGYRAFAMADMVLGYRFAVDPTVEMMEQGSTAAGYDVPQVTAGNIYRAMEAMRVIRGMPQPSISLLVQMTTRIEELEQMIADMVVGGAKVRPDEQQSLALFAEWYDSVRSKKPFSTVNMRTERQNAYLAGLNKGIELSK